MKKQYLILAFLVTTLTILAPPKSKFVCMQSSKLRPTIAPKTPTLFPALAAVLDSVNIEIGTMPDLPVYREQPSLFAQDFQQIKEYINKRLAKRANDIVHLLGTMKTSIANLGLYRSQLERKVAQEGKYMNKIDKLIIQGELDLIRSYLALDGMNDVSVIQKAETINQALWAYSQVKDLPKLSPVVLQAAKISLESYPGYAQYMRDQALAQQQEFRAPTIESVSRDHEQPIIHHDLPAATPSISETTDLTTQAPWLEMHETSSPIRTRFFEIYDEVKNNCSLGPNVEQDVLSAVYKQMCQEGYFTETTPGISPEEVSYFVERYIYHLKPTNPLTHPKEFLTNTAKYATWWAINLVATEGAGAVIKVISAASHLQELGNVDFSKMTRNERIDFIAQQAAEITWAVVTDKACNKVMPGAKPFVRAQTTSPSEAVVQGAAQFAEAESVVAVTPEGVPVEVAPEIVPDTSVLKKAADKVDGAAKCSTTQATEATEKIEWIRYRSKHKPPQNISWKKIVESTKSCPAKYKPEINIEAIELQAWKSGRSTTNGKSWKVFECKDIIGAKDGIETRFVVVKNSGNTIHGHPILVSEYRKYIK